MTLARSGRHRRWYARRSALSLVELLISIVLVGALAGATTVAGTALLSRTNQQVLLAELYAHGKAGLAYAQVGDARHLAADDFIATAPQLEQVTVANDPAPLQPHAEAVWLHRPNDTQVLVTISVDRERAVLAGTRDGQTAAVSVTWLGRQGSSVAYEVNFDDALTSDSSSGDPTVDAGDAVEETESGDGDSGDTGPPCDPPGQGGRPPGQGGLIPGTCELAPPYDTDAPV